MLSSYRVDTHANVPCTLQYKMTNSCEQHVRNNRFIPTHRGARHFCSPLPEQPIFADGIVFMVQLTLKPGILLGRAFPETEAPVTLFRLGFSRENGANSTWGPLGKLELVSAKSFSLVLLVHAGILMSRMGGTVCPTLLQQWNRATKNFKVKCLESRSYFLRAYISSRFIVKYKHKRKLLQKI